MKQLFNKQRSSIVKSLLCEIDTSNNAKLRYFDLVLFETESRRSLCNAAIALPSIGDDNNGAPSETAIAHAILMFYAQHAPHLLPFVVVGTNCQYVFSRQMRNEIV
jgi:hypothetical protein